MPFNTEQSAHIALKKIVAEKTSNLVAWVGAGLSRPAGLPTWSELRNRLCRVLTERAEQDPESRTSLLRTRDEILKQDLWIAFERLRKTLGQTTYRSEIYEALTVGHHSNIPPNYERLWKLRLGGVLNLNLDSLVIRAYSQTFPSQIINEFSGIQVKDSIHVLRSRVPFVANLHGMVENESSWVFTRSEIKRLVNDENYNIFINSCLTTRTVLFVGLTIDDVSVGGFLEDLRRLGASASAHFWVTNRRDNWAREWAEDNGVRIILYDDRDDHAELADFFEDLLGAVSYEEETPPLTPDVGTAVVQELPEPAELMKRNDEEIRKLLNAYAANILAPGGAESYERYKQFCKKYDREIYSSYYVGLDPPNNIVLGHKLTQELGSGGFGHVFRGVTPDHVEVAIKLLHENARNDHEMLQSFRRGVKSMRILARHGVDGMVAYHQASEIPAFVVMDFVDGPNLKEAVDGRLVSDWHDLLRIAVDLARIIHSAHSLPERVLHRDIRPPNIMLKGFYQDSQNWKVVVLDFDMSWHRDAFEKTIASREGSSGYVAPEQLQCIGVKKTRNARVDSFGLAMTLFFLRTGDDPQPNQQRQKDWSVFLRQQIGRTSCPAWLSLPRRYARLIECNTKDNQSERWDMYQILSELERLYDAASAPREVQSAELIAEELICRTSLGPSYTWDENQFRATARLANGLEIQLQPSEVNRVIDVQFRLVNRGNEEHKNVGKYMQQRLDKAASLLRRSEWQEIKPYNFGGESHLSARIDAMYCREHLEQIVDALEQALEAFHI